MEDGRLIGSVAGSLARNPIIIAIAAGGLVSASRLWLPPPPENFTSPLSDAAGPCALFALGATLVGRSISTGATEISYMTICKLLVHPAAIWVSTNLIFDVDPLWAMAATLAASLPVAANVFIVARQYYTYVERVSGAIPVSTTMSIFSVSALLLVLD